MAGSTHALPTADIVARAEAARKRVPRGLESWRRFRRHRLAVASSAILALIILTVVLGPLWWQVPINDIDFTARLAGPSWQHPFGTDDLGQDLLARLLYGGRVSLGVGLAAVLVAVVAGPAGGAAGARPVLVAAREGIRRGGARARRIDGAPGGAPHPAQCPRPGDRRRHHRGRRRDHRGIDAVVPGIRLSTRHPHLGTPALRRQGLPRHRATLGAVSRHRDLSCRADDPLHRRRLARHA